MRATLYIALVLALLAFTGGASAATPALHGKLASKSQRIVPLPDVGTYRISPLWVKAY